MDSIITNEHTNINLKYMNRTNQARVVQSSPDRLDLFTFLQTKGEKIGWRMKWQEWAVTTWCVSLCIQACLPPTQTHLHRLLAAGGAQSSTLEVFAIAFQVS